MGLLGIGMTSVPIIHRRSVENNHEQVSGDTQISEDHLCNGRVTSAGLSDRGDYFNLMLKIFKLQFNNIKEFFKRFPKSTISYVKSIRSGEGGPNPLTWLTL